MHFAIKTIATIGLTAAVSYTIKSALERKKARERAQCALNNTLYSIAKSMSYHEIDIEVAWIRYGEQLTEQIFRGSHPDTTLDAFLIDRHDTCRARAEERAQSFLNKYALRLLLEPHRERLITLVRASGQDWVVGELEQFEVELHELRQFFEQQGINIEALDAQLVGS